MTQYDDLKDYMARKPPQETAHDIVISAARCIGLGFDKKGVAETFSSNSVRKILADIGYDPRKHINDFEHEAGQVYRQLVETREAVWVDTEPSENPKSNRSRIGKYQLTEWGRKVAQMRFKAATPPVPPAQSSMFPNP